MVVAESESKLDSGCTTVSSGGGNEGQCPMGRALDSSFANKGPSSQGYGFSSGHVWMWELDYKESWVLKNWHFDLWCWRRLLRVPWTARRSNQSILKEISPGCSLEGLMLKLKLQSFGHLMLRAESFEKTMILGKIVGRRRKDDRGWNVGWHHRLSGHGFG